MNVQILDNKTAIGSAVCGLICDRIREKPDCVLGLATGATPVPTYDALAAAYVQGAVSFRNVRTFNLDEYCDLPKTHKNSFYSFMQAQLFSRVDMDPANIGFLDGNVDPAAESVRYTAAIEAAGGIDLQLLGIGRNGHIAFNEPADAFSQESFRVALSESTRIANAGYFDDVPMPRYAITMGVGLILRARQLIMIATGESKAAAVKAMLEGPVTPQCPASALQTHPDVLVFLDPAAASLLS
ncbi:MAG: glucosamine-6-phosphate deaminase [Clostridia bacterium]|nr:glucosamine-6-phosphate deaminase [Clostridia bacterium]